MLLVRDYILVGDGLLVSFNDNSKATLTYRVKDSKLTADGDLTEEQRAALESFVNNDVDPVLPQIDARIRKNTSGLGQQKAVILTLNDFRKGVTSPADSTIGTTPTISTFRFNSVLELISSTAMMPSDWDSKDITIVLITALTATETIGDDISMKMDYVLIVPESPGTGPNRTSTRVTADHTLTAGSGLDAGDVHTIMFPVSATDVTNPIPSTTSPKGLGMEFSLNNTVGVAEIDLIAACIVYTSLY